MSSDSVEPRAVPVSDGAPQGSPDRPQHPSQERQGEPGTDEKEARARDIDLEAALSNYGSITARQDFVRSANRSRSRSPASSAARSDHDVRHETCFNEAGVMVESGDYTFPLYRHLHLYSLLLYRDAIDEAEEELRAWQRKRRFSRGSREDSEFGAVANHRSRSIGSDQAASLRGSTRSTKLQDAAAKLSLPDPPRAESSSNVAIPSLSPPVTEKVTAHAESNDSVPPHVQDPSIGLPSIQDNEVRLQQMEGDRGARNSPMASHPSPARDLPPDVLKKLASKEFEVKLEKLQDMLRGYTEGLVLLDELMHLTPLNTNSNSEWVNINPKIDTDPLRDALSRLVIRIKKLAARWWRRMRPQQAKVSRRYKERRAHGVADVLARFLVSIVGGISLIVPMLMMTFLESRTAHLLITSLFVLAFSIAISAATRASNQELLAATAGYAAVLVVFVGTSTPVTTPTTPGS